MVLAVCIITRLFSSTTQKPMKMQFATLIKMKVLQLIVLAVFVGAEALAPAMNALTMIPGLIIMEIAVTGTMVMRTSVGITEKALGTLAALVVVVLLCRNKKLIVWMTRIM